MSTAQSQPALSFPFDTLPETGATLEVAPGVRLQWLTEIRHVRDGRYFVDEQRRGPYALWYHEHRFEPKDGGVLMTDRVTYALPFGWLGDLVYALWVGRQLHRIFDFRREAVAKVFAR